MGNPATSERLALGITALLFLVPVSQLSGARNDVAPPPAGNDGATTPPPRLLPAAGQVDRIPSAPLLESALRSSDPDPQEPLTRVAIGRTAAQLGAESLCMQQAGRAPFAARIVRDRDAIEHVLLGEADFGLAALPLSALDRQRGLRDELLAIELFALAVAEHAPVRNLRADQVRLVLTGQLRDWVQLGLPPAPIVVAAPADEGMRVRAARVLIPGDALAADAARLDADRDLVGLLAGTPGVIGVVRVGAVHDAPGVRLLPIDGILPSTDAYRGGAYPYGTPVLAVHRGLPGRAVVERLERARNGRPPFGDRRLSPVR